MPGIYVALLPGSRIDRIQRNPAGSPVGEPGHGPDPTTDEVIAPL